jgi:hypothetical protein
VPERSEPQPRASQQHVAIMPRGRLGMTRIFL